jgi:hypothetical protein
MTIIAFVDKLNKTPELVQFPETISLIEDHYDFIPTAFKNGSTTNEAGQNSGSCKVFSFAKLQGLSVEQTLHCFGDFYRVDVLQHPDAEDHQNIRNFIKHGWEGIVFDAPALQLKQTDN